MLEEFLEPDSFATAESSHEAVCAGGRPAVFERSEFAGLAFFWLLFWGNAKKVTRQQIAKSKGQECNEHSEYPSPYY